MKNITLINDPLRIPKFLTKTRNNRDSIINLFGALSDVLLYYRKKSKLNGSAYLVGVQKFIKQYLDEMNIVDLLNTYNSYLDLNVNQSNFHKRIDKWVENDRIPLEFIRVISITLSDNKIVQKHFLINIFLKVLYITDRTGISKFKPPLFLKDILNSFKMYDIGVSAGDGGLTRNRQEISDGSVNGEDISLTKIYLEKLKQFKQNIWGLSDRCITITKGEKENRNVYKLVVGNKSYVSYLNFVYGLPIGDKLKQGLKEPDILRFVNSKKRHFLRRFFYRGLFDTDGSYAKDSSKISFWTNSHVLLNQTKDFLQKSGIYFTSTKYEIRISSRSYKDFIGLVGSSHDRKLKKILNRLSKSPKSYFFNGLNQRMMINGHFDFKNTNFHVKGLGGILKEFRHRAGFTQKQYAKLLGLSVGTLKCWEQNLNATPIKEICRVIELNNIKSYEELSKRCSYFEMGKISLPLKISEELLELAKFVIPQKSFNHACVIKREGTNLKNNELNSLIKRIEAYFNCKVQIHKDTNAFYIHSSYLALFLDTFFIYEKSWSKMTTCEKNALMKKMNQLLEVSMEEKLPFERIERQIITKREAETDKRYGKIPEERTVKELLDYGIVNINKPDGPT